MKKFSGFLGLAVLASCAQLAQAALQLSYSVNGATPVACALTADDGPAVCLPGTVSPITIQLLDASSNSPGTPANSQEAGSTLVISTPVAATLKIWIAAQDFTTPSAPPDILFSSGLTTNSTTGIGTASLTSCVDTTNGLAPPAVAFCAAGPSLTNTLESYSGSSTEKSAHCILDYYIALYAVLIV